MSKNQVTVDQKEDRLLHQESKTERNDSAEQLVRRIKHAIRRDTGSRIHNLAVKVTGTHVVLHGFCSTFHSFQLAQHAAKVLAEELGIDNQIEVL